MTNAKNELGMALKLWRRTARGRLRFELGGLAFAMEKGASPEEYARHLWGTGARAWLGKQEPNAAEYLGREADAFHCFYPEVTFEVTRSDKDGAELVFTGGCLGGWGDTPWALAAGFGLVREDICRYCRAAFRLWAGQLGLLAAIGPSRNGARCVLRVERPAPDTKP